MLVVVVEGSKTTLRFSDFLGGPTELGKAVVLTVTVSYSKRTQITISEERKRIGQNPGETYLQAYGCPCTVESDRQFLILLVTVWDNMYEVLLIRKAHLSLGA